MSTTRWIIEKACERCGGSGIESCYEPQPCDGEPCRSCHYSGVNRLVVDPDNLPPERVRRAAKVLYEALGLDPDDDPWESVLIYQKQLAADMRAAAAQTVTAFLSDPEPGDQT